MHLIGLDLHEMLGTKWVADFRDPWTNIDFYRELLLTKAADRCHHRLERKVLEQADHIITVSPGMTNEYKSMGIDHVTTLTNGFDHDRRENKAFHNNKFSILHLGSMPGSRNPVSLWNVLSVLVKNIPQFGSLLEIRLIGRLDAKVLDSIQKLELQKYLVHENYVPHEKTFEILTGSAVLLLCINNTPNAPGILTNKFFEYLSAGRPILAIGPPEGDAAAILKESGAGMIFDYPDHARLEKHVLRLFELYLQQKLTVENRHIDKFSRKNLTRDLTELLTKMIR
jgi:hypothetical protein